MTKIKKERKNERNNIYIISYKAEIYKVSSCVSVFVYMTPAKTLIMLWVIQLVRLFTPATLYQIEILVLV